MYENFVASEFLKSGIELKYWRTKSMAEVDFIIEKDGKTMPVEIKSNLAKPNFTKSFLSFLDKYGPEKSFILSEKLFSEKNKTKFRPIFCAWNEIS
ncbi:DUF4143 domain-containing protein [Candidatus Woesearchaeota archaeon]|nr:DUF4143 domain-containing protein [Candidatus Woesearchaeota archaeon]